MWRSLREVFHFCLLIVESELTRINEAVQGLQKVRIIRSETRLGLTQARILGVSDATARVVVVMDSHVEVTIGWLVPLLDPIAANQHTITIPGIEPLDPQTFEYHNIIKEGYNWVGGFNWMLLFEPFRLIQSDVTETVFPSPAMVGTVFAISKEYFEYLGYYDTGFQLWGGDNLELSFKVWMCGGQMLQVFCSHVGHLARIPPYVVRNDTTSFM